MGMGIFARISLQREEIRIVKRGWVSIAALSILLDTTKIGEEVGVQRGQLGHC